MVNIVVIGSAVMVVMFRIPRGPVMGESLLGDSSDLCMGGKGTDQAIAAARLGAKVHLVACLGDDVFADMAEKLYRTEGIDTDHVRHMQGLRTGVAVAMVAPSGDNWLVGHLGANEQMGVAEVDAVEHLIARSDVVMTQFEVPLETISRAMELGRKHGVRTLLNPGPAKRVRPDQLANVDILTPNETETRILLGLPPDDPTSTDVLAKRLFDLGVRNIVVTMGKQGALIVTPGGSERVPAPVVKSVDSTGAGDGFNACLAVGLAEGLTLRDAVAQAVYAGAYSVTLPGWLDSFPTRAQLAEFRRSHK